jgi:hypothetical protein
MTSPESFDPEPPRIRPIDWPALCFWISVVCLYASVILWWAA